MLATRLLASFLRDDLAEEVSGDLEERYYQNIKTRSLLFARFRYWIEVVNYVRPFALRRSKGSPLYSFDMFQNYFKITGRNLLRQKLYSFINIGGLTLGLTCFITIMLYVQHEFQYNRFYPNSDNIYRIYQQQAGNAFLGTDYFGVTPAQTATALMDEFPEVKDATCITEPSGLLSIGDNHYYQKGLAADSNIFKVLSMPFVEGAGGKALTDPKSIVLTRSLANTMFGDESPLGKMLMFGDQPDYQVTAVIEDPPVTSSLKYTFIININYNTQYVDEMKRAGWNNNSYYTFFVLRDGADPAALEAKMPAFIDRHHLKEEYKDYPFRDTFHIERIADMYFHGDINFDIGIKGNKQAVYLFAGVALLVLLLACVNYMNLAVARSIKRAREVGLRKVAGAMRQQLLGQFLAESILITFLSLVLAVGLAYLLVPYFGRLVERPVEMNFFANPWLLPALAVVTLTVGLISGSYPAMIMSGLRPIEVLKAKSDVKVSGFSLQRALIVVQFAASTALVIASLVIYQQLDYMRNKELGYSKENIVTVRLRDFGVRSKFVQLSNEWAQNPNIIHSTIASHLPTNVTSSTMIKSKAGLDKRDLAVYQLSTEYNYIDLFDLTLVAGRNFSPEFNDSTENNFILNESAVKALGWTPEEAIGQSFNPEAPQQKVIGVVKDFHMHSMHEPIHPLMIRFSQFRGSYFVFRINPEATQETIQYLERTIRKVSPYPFEYEFVEDNYNKLYSGETRLGEIFGTFTVVAIVIASLGLFGLAAFMAGQRTKEIGIRKVLGASSQSIVVLVAKDFMMLVAVAFVVAVPLGWYAMNSWLQQFAYRVEMQWWVFAAAGMLALLIANISIGYQSLRAAAADPVDSLRGE